MACLTGVSDPENPLPEPHGGVVCRTRCRRPAATHSARAAWRTSWRRRRALPPAPPATAPSPSTCCRCWGAAPAVTRINESVIDVIDACLDQYSVVMGRRVLVNGTVERSFLRQADASA